MRLALSARGSCGFSHLTTTLASTTSLGTVLQLFPSFQSQVSQVNLLSCEPLTKFFHPRNECSTLFYLLRRHLPQACLCHLLHRHRHSCPIGQAGPFFQDDHVVFYHSFIWHWWASSVDQ